MSDPDYCVQWFGCYSMLNHWHIMLLNLFSSLTAFALAYVLYHVFRQRKLLLMPLVLGGLCLLLVLWGFVGDAGLVAAARTYRDDRVSLRVLPGQQREEDYYAALTLLALGATGLLVLGWHESAGGVARSTVRADGAAPHRKPPAQTIGADRTGMGRGMGLIVRARLQL